MNLEAVYPNPADPTQEFCFEELRAQHRGWLDRKWIPDRRRKIGRESEPNFGREASNNYEEATEIIESFQATPTQQSTISLENTDDPILGKALKKASDGSKESKPGRPRKMKVMEVRGETQMSKMPSVAWMIRLTLY